METTGETISRPRWQLTDDRGQVPTLYPFCGMWAAKRNRRQHEMTTQTTYTAADDVTADTSGLVAVLGGQFLATGVMTVETFEQTFVGTAGGFETLDDARQNEFVAFGPFSDAVLDELLSSGELVEQELRLLGIAA